MSMSRKKVGSWHSTRKLKAIFAVDVMRDDFDCNVSFANSRLARLVLKIGPLKFEVEDVRSLLATNPSHDFWCPVQGSVGVKAIKLFCDWLGLLCGVTPNPNRLLGIGDIDDLDTIDQNRSSVPVYYSESWSAAPPGLSLRFDCGAAVSEKERSLLPLFRKLTSGKSYSHDGSDQSNPTTQCAEPTLQATVASGAEREVGIIRQETHRKRHQAKNSNGAATNVKRSLGHCKNLNLFKGRRIHRACVRGVATP